MNRNQRAGRSDATRGRFSGAPLAVVLTAFAALLAVAAAPAPALGDEFVRRANALYAGVEQERRSDLLLLPVLGEMDEAPIDPTVAESTQLMMLFTTDSSFWPTLEAWANAPAQRAALDVLMQITEDENPRTAYVFAQPYGVEGIPIDLVIAGMYTELGDPPMLAAAQHLYMPAVDALAVLAHAEATRLAANGEVSDAVEVVFRWLLFTRQLADREFYAEKVSALSWMYFAIEHLRDIVYQDARSGSPRLTGDDMIDLIERMDLGRGYLNLDRLSLPRAERIAAEQLVSRVFVHRGGPDENVFGPLLARIAATDRPLRLFSETARWNTVARAHADWFDTRDKVDAVFGDWEHRWGLSPFDPVISNPTEYSRAGREYELVSELVPDISPLFKLRQSLRAQIAGTRMALAVNGHFLDTGGRLPVALSAVRPRYIRSLEDDPYNPSSRPFEFFVPIRDRPAGERDDPQPHRIRVWNPEGLPNFAVNIGDDQFVLYSVGPDGRRNWARDMTQSTEDFEGDYVVWPPWLSLVRQHLIDTGQLN